MRLKNFCEKSRKTHLLKEMRYTADEICLLRSGRGLATLEKISLIDIFGRDAECWKKKGAWTLIDTALATDEELFYLMGKKNARKSREIERRELRFLIIRDDIVGIAHTMGYHDATIWAFEWESLEQAEAELAKWKE